MLSFFSVVISLLKIGCTCGSMSGNSQRSDNVSTGWERLATCMAAVVASSATAILFHIPIDHHYTKHSKQLSISHAGFDHKLLSTLRFSKRYYQSLILGNMKVFVLYDVLSSFLGCSSSTAMSVALAGVSGSVSYMVGYPWTLPKVVKVNYILANQSMYDKYFYRSLPAVFLSRGLSLGLFDAWSKHVMFPSEYNGNVMKDFGMRWILAVLTSTIADLATFPFHKFQMASTNSAATNTWRNTVNEMFISRGLLSFYEGYLSSSTMVRIHRPSIVLSVYSLCMNTISRIF